MTYVTTSQTPVYKPNGGFYIFVRSLPAGTEVNFTGTDTDPFSSRTVGLLPTGEVMYLDALSPLLDEVHVKDSRLWDWLLWVGTGIALIFYTHKKNT